MEKVATRNFMVRVELTCFYCGHSCGDVRVSTAGRPSYREIRDAVETTPGAAAVEWDPHGAPRCPRCRGKLLIEESERRSYANVSAAQSRQ